ncbi:hypothetical protein K7X08_022410 [Anisodus acutangulus]|uniref:Response regulatory domain-containing protein n=1 Tax=Anisodus acutangulus TaxID=402998 RepID=A0A9Q1RKG8_9SOLA|nr:hypothetical protein K7X08_022410 [Anisodus acutangulus]
MQKDLILSEVDLPMSKGVKMLKYIMRDTQLRHIPVIMMSSQDEVSIVVKCLKFGAADYLVKPLRTNELLNLWTHMWRRRRMLGLAEKNILSYDFDLVVSEPSDPNTNSTTLFSDDTDDKSWKCVKPELCPSTMLQEDARYKSNAVPVETAVVVPSEHPPDAPGADDRKTGHLPKSNGQSATSIHESVRQQLGIEEKTSLSGHLQIDTKIQVTEDVVESHLQGDGYPSSNDITKSFSIERSCTPPISQEFPHYRNSKMEKFSQVHMHPQNEVQHDVSRFHAQQTPYPYYIQGVMNHVMMPSTQIYQKSMQHLHNHANSAMLPQYNHMPQYPNMHRLSSYPFYLMGMCSSSAEIKVSKVDHRETVLMKFRQKRKGRCFDKKISILIYGFNLSSPRFILFLSATGAIIYSTILASTLIICNLALVLSGMEKIGGYMAILKACFLIRGEKATALSLALIFNLALAAVEVLFPYRIVNAYHHKRTGLSSIALEGIFIAYLYAILFIAYLDAILLVLVTISSCLFFEYCKTGCHMDEDRSFLYQIEIEDRDHHAVLLIKNLEELS